MKNLFLIIAALMIGNIGYANEGGDINGTWQTFKKDCAITKVIKIDREQAVKECRIRFKIKEQKCQYATVTYGTMVGKVLKRGKCFLDPDTKQLEVIVKTHNGTEVSEFDAFIVGAEDGFDRSLIETIDHDDKKVWFYKLKRRN